MKILLHASIAVKEYWNQFYNDMNAHKHTRARSHKPIRTHTVHDKYANERVTSAYRGINFVSRPVGIFVVSNE